jgi:hypothetical protein
MNAALQQGDQETFWFGMDAGLGALGNISKILLPPGPRSQTQRRGRQLRAAFGVALRDAFEHFDERIDRWFRQSPRRNFADLQALIDEVQTLVSRVAERHKGIWWDRSPDGAGISPASRVERLGGQAEARRPRRSSALRVGQQVTRQQRTVHGVLAGALSAAQVGWVVQPVRPMGPSNARWNDQRAFRPPQSRSLPGSVC